MHRTIQKVSSTGSSDVGACKLKGDLIYNPSDQDYVISGSGDNIWFTSDQFHFAWKKLKGDFILTADVQFSGEGSHLHRKAGWMIRQSLDPGSAHISATVHGDGLTSLQYRPAQERRCQKGNRWWQCHLM